MHYHIWPYITTSNHYHIYTVQVKDNIDNYNTTGVATNIPDILEGIRRRNGIYVQFHIEVSPGKKKDGRSGCTYVFS